MALTNHERVGKALDLLKSGLYRYVEREMKAVYRNQWEEMAGGAVPEKISSGKKDWQEYWDIQRLLVVMWEHWPDVFGKTLGHAERSLVSELREIRKNWAHQQAFSTNDTHRALDTTARMLTAVAAHEEAAMVEKMRMDLLRVQFEDQRRAEMRKVSFQPTSGNPQGGLKPWREVVTPHPDVASGRYQQAEFAADLWQVYQKEGSDEYRNPTEFFRRTFVTEGLRQLMSRGIERLAGTGGDPVVELQTNFGGGKTHSMLALYHLFSGTPPVDMPGSEEIVKQVGVTLPPNVRRVVIVGTKISAGDPSKKSDGTVVNTLWGEIAWQLGGKEGYEMVRLDDERGTSPGDRLKELFNRYAPCLVLIDEWVAYARQLHEGVTLPAGTFETQFTFAQTLSESAKAAKQTLLVVSIPASDNEIGGEWGKIAAARLKNAIGRVESSWRPASPDEGFEIVRRRLFQPLTNEQAISRDAVARAFVDMYGSQAQEFPSECRESEYERRIKMAYPIHPELFDRLYTDWSTLDKFQRTRGVLRLMAAVIHSLWERQDSNLLIMPGTIPADEQTVQGELTRYLEDNWVPIIEKDIDSPNSLPLTIDRETPSLGRYSACRRVARTIYLGSAPTSKVANKGIDERRIKLGCIQPGESVATFGDALRRLTDKATYLYEDGTRYWYSTQPSVTRLAEDRAIRMGDDAISDEIIKRLRNHARSRGGFAKVYPCNPGSDIPDERVTRLLFLEPKYHHSSKSETSPARVEAEKVLECRGNSPRMYRNTLVFLAADEARLAELNLAVRQYLSWSSIVNDKETLDLTPFQTGQAQTKMKNSDETVEVRIPETYQWLLVPNQGAPKEGIQWFEARLQGRDEDLASRASKKLIHEDYLKQAMAGTTLRLHLDKIPLWRGEHVSVRQLSEDFATYLYLPKLVDEQVLYQAIKDGLKGLGTLVINQETFAFATGFDEHTRQYVGLQAPLTDTALHDSNALLVKPEVAVYQISQQVPTAGVGGVSDPGGPGGSVIIGGNAGFGGTYTGFSGTTKNPVTPLARPQRFYGARKIDISHASRDISEIVNEVVLHLQKQKNAGLELTLEIKADIPEGADEGLVRTVSENCRTLKFDSFEFE